MISRALTLLEAELRQRFETNQRIAFEMAAQKGWETHMTYQTAVMPSSWLFLIMEPQNTTLQIIVKVQLQLEQTEYTLVV